MTLTDKVLDTLKAAGLDARKPANYAGECKAPYLVVQDGGEQPGGGKTTCKRAVVIYGFAPYTQPGKLPTLLEDTRAALGALPALRLSATSEETIDDSFKAVTANLTYTALCAR